MTDDEIKAAIAAQILLPEFPRSGRYDPQWQFDNSEGATLWSVEWLSEAMSLTPGMRVLDLGCGRAAASIFLAREFGVSVVAVDIEPPPSENWARIVEAGCADSILPMRADARDLKFAEGYFDAIVGIGSFHEFGTDDLYPHYLLRFLRPGGQIGLIIPGVTAELNGHVPDDLQHCWDPNYYTFHTPSWWARQFVNSGAATVTTADLIPDGWRYWLIWEQLVADFGPADMREWYAAMAEGMRRDAGRVLGLVRLVATRRAKVTVSPTADQGQ